MSDSSLNRYMKGRRILHIDMVPLLSKKESGTQRMAGITLKYSTG